MKNEKKMKIVRKMNKREEIENTLMTITFYHQPTILQTIQQSTNQPTNELKRE